MKKELIMTEWDEADWFKTWLELARIAEDETEDQ